MTIYPLHNYKREEKFLKVSKNDTHYRYAGLKYDVAILYHSSNFYSPDFFTLSVTDKSGKPVWDGSQLIIHGDFMSQTFLSESYDCLVLPVVHDTSDSHSMQVVYVDLKTGSCKPITNKGFYPYCGHFLSFNGIFWGETSGIRCADFDGNKEFHLSDILSTPVSDMLTWSPCMVGDSVLIITKASARNVLLFDVKQGVVRSEESIIFKTADKVNVTCQPSWSSNRAVVAAHYFTKSQSGVFQMQGCDYYEILL